MPVSANPALVVWPTVEGGFTSKMRMEALKAAGRVQHHPAKLEQFLADLKIIAAHAKERMAAAQARVEAQRQEAIRKNLARKRREREDKRARALAMRAQAKQLTAHATKIAQELADEAE